MKYQKGASLVITFLIMTIMLAMVLSISTISFNQVRILNNTGNSISSFFAAESGAEKTLYFDRKQIPIGGNRGICNICNSCSANDCNNCTTTHLEINGCNAILCTNCKVTYDYTFDDREYSTEAKVTPNSSNPALYDFKIIVKGLYAQIIRAIELNSTQ